VAAAILVGGASELVVARLDGPLDVSRAQLVDDATELFLAWATRPPPSPPPAPADAAAPRTAGQSATWVMSKTCQPSVGLNCIR
jgi:hypothetical protein